MNRSNTQSRRLRLGRNPQRSRRGSATVELAVCLPMLALLVFGSIQACNLLHLKHVLTSAAYEGTLELSRVSATSDSVETRVNSILTMYKINGASVEIIPDGNNFELLDRGEPVQITVRASTNSNLALDGWFPCPETIECTTVGPK